VVKSLNAKRFNVSIGQTGGLELLHRDTSASYSPPEAFGRFRVLHQAGAGALGPVFRGQDPERDRVVAIKVFRLDITPEQAAELAAELQKLVDRNLTHPCLVTLVAAGVEGSVPYLVQDYVAADSLDAALRQYGPAPVPQALWLLTQLAGALDFAAAVGVHHGNLHPRDILVAPADSRLTGIGVTEAFRRTRVRVALRRPYVAPERIDDTAVPGRQSDVFSLAVIAHELLTGRRPVAVGTRLTGRLQTLPAYRPAVDDVFVRALAPIAEDRFGVALDFVTALQDAFGAVGGQVSVAEPLAKDPPPVATEPQRRPRPDLNPEALDLPLEPVAAPPAGADAIDVGLLDQSAKEFEFHEPAAGAAPEGRQPDLVDLGPTDEQLMEPGGARPMELFDLNVGDRRMRRPRPTLTPDLSLLDRAVPAHGPEEAAGEPASDRLSSARVAPIPPGRERLGPRRASGLSLLLMLLVGLLVGFVGGYITGSSGWLASGSVPSVSKRTSAVVPGEAAAQAPASSAVPAPAQPAGPTGTPGTPDERAPATAGAASAPTTPERGVAPTPAPGAPFIGRMQIRSTPAGAAVTVNGAPRGATPLNLRELGLGRYSIEVSLAGYATEQRQVSLTRARPNLAVNLRLKRAEEPAPAATAPTTPESSGSLVVDSLPPGARVFLDGRPVGTTPLALDKVAAGSHVVRLELTGYNRWSSMVQIAAGERSKVTGSLEREGHW
jgi:hypothetical protein